MEINDKYILSELKSNREKGFRILMQKFKEPVYWHIRRLVVSHYDAQDIVQETFVKVFRSIDKFKGNSSLSTWIYKISTNEALRFLNSKKVENNNTDLPSDNMMEADTYVDYSDLEVVKLRDAILTLPKKQQITFNLRYYDELGYDEIAEITESTSLSAKANYHTAKEKITKFMNSNY
nr:RNA polymerase sigma factor [Prevotella sp.]